jgi:hypothetical protein
MFESALEGNGRGANLVGSQAFHSSERIVAHPEVCRIFAFSGCFVLQNGPDPQKGAGPLGP